MRIVLTFGLDPFTKVYPTNRRKVKLKTLANPMMFKMVEDRKLDAEMVTLLWLVIRPFYTQNMLTYKS